MKRYIKFIIIFLQKNNFFTNKKLVQVNINTKITKKILFTINWHNNNFFMRE